MTKTASVFHRPHLLRRARERADDWAVDLRRRAVAAAQPWMRMSDDALWSLMFGNTLRRSWMVWSSGFCPACRRDTPMYTWQIDALARPWKVRCPHCAELFPKNDFHAFYRSGLDTQGVFDPARADRALLFNAEHPAPDDPLRDFGVDDGNGYADGEHRWWFIATYLIYGQWKQLIVGGIRHVSVAYALTGEAGYAHKAGLLLDRVADLYPTFDFKGEGVMYEGPAHAGYVSTWHDACEEARELALAYDRVFDALQVDETLAAFLNHKARDHGITAPKSTPRAVCDNIEQGILRDTLANPHKIRSNYPRTEAAQCVIQMVLDWPANRAEVMALLDATVAQATAVDGVTGEKGLSGYSAFTIQGLALLLGLIDRIDAEFLPELLRRHPALRNTWRFFIDTWCWQPVAGDQTGWVSLSNPSPAGGAMRRYYPLAGDCGVFAQTSEQYAGVAFDPNQGVDSAALGYALGPSMHTFLGRLYDATGDPAYLQVIYHANGNTTAGLPYDLFAGDAASFQNTVADVIAREGATPRVTSVNKQQWHLAMLRSRSATAWLKYDTGQRHGHLDGLNLGLFAKGLDLMPDFGYPPVHRGGWSGRNFDWYVGTLSHNTVVVDGKPQQRDKAGQTTLWRADAEAQVIRVAAPDIIGGGRFERTLALIDLSSTDAYLLDVFRVAGGAEHVRCMHSAFARLTTRGLTLRPLTDEAFLFTWRDAIMRAYQIDPSPAPGWQVDWQIEDRYGYLPAGADVHLRCADLSANAQAVVAEAWVSIGGFNSVAEAWIPRLMTRRVGGAAPLASTFVALIEPYAGQSNIAAIRRLSLGNDTHVAVEACLSDGRRDVLVVTDPEAGDRSALPDAIRQACGFWFDGDLCVVRFDSEGRVAHSVAEGGRVEF